VTDGSGNRDTDTVNIRVKDRVPPNANAGENQVVSHGITMHFDGSNSTDNVGVVNYTWTFFDNSNIMLYGINPEYVFLTLGTHIVTLTVKDEAGNIDTDTVNIVVKDATKPTIEIISPEPVVHSRDCIVKCVVTDNVKVESVKVSLNNYSWSSCIREDADEYAATLILKNGENMVYIRATDSSGNVNTTSITVLVEAPENAFPLFTPNTMLLLIGMIFCISATIILEHKPKRRKGL
ncbi:MAG: PKD domain-containing protein, partial [Thermoplasmatales archaeon]|nr:PKD domain-containing protein [Thermoplasmatales archaeon]